MPFLNITGLIILSSLLSLLPIEGAAEPASQRPSYRPVQYKHLNYKDNASYQKCQSLFPESSCIAELFSAIGAERVAEACRPGGRLSGNEPLLFDQRTFVYLERDIVCAKPVWQPGKCAFFNNYAFTAEQYRPICQVCFPSSV
ncbi:hypothetical protein CP533_4763 [Ophiocordyceps camponoti-saundersi (nom. inval.)]|nr:hypothetical protein CP533_4763 [Ophiocordyceps camponoti-saundersi (nom. inval.)]